jgi:hypothetical protein
MRRFGARFSTAVCTTLRPSAHLRWRVSPNHASSLRSCLAWRTPSAQMDETALASCIAWVRTRLRDQSIFPGWKFSASDTIAANAMHRALVVGPCQPLAPRAAEWQRTPSAFGFDLSRDGRLADRGDSRKLLSGPLPAPRHLTGLLASDPKGDADRPRRGLGRASGNRAGRNPSSVFLKILRPKCKSLPVIADRDQQKS